MTALSVHPDSWVLPLDLVTAAERRALQIAVDRARRQRLGEAEAASRRAIEARCPGVSLVGRPCANAPRFDGWCGVHRPGRGQDAALESDPEMRIGPAPVLTEAVPYFGR